jgi:hypothetical protein
LTWSISCGSAVTLPFGPSETRISNPAKIDLFTQEGDDPIVIVDGAESYKVEFTGVLYDCWDSVVAPLLAMRGKVVDLVTPDGDLDGQFVLASFEPRRVGAQPRWSYTMRLVKGSSYVVL